MWSSLVEAVEQPAVRQLRFIKKQELSYLYKPFIGNYTASSNCSR